MIYSSRSGGKWILSGEHTVLRGGEAILFPLSSLFLETKYTPHSAFDFTSLQTQYPDKNFLKMVLQKAFFLLGSSQKARGKWSIQFTLPYGSGLGWSAAFCLNIAHIFSKQKWIQEKEILKFSLELEHLFHQKSSGADLQAIFYKQPILFRSFSDTQRLHLKWKPYFYLFNTHQKSETKQCVQKVLKWTQAFPNQSLIVDQKMRYSVHTALRALNCSGSIQELKQSIYEAERCFEQWSLMSDAVKQTSQKMKKKGAIATKPTGSGDGGFVLGLWSRPLVDEEAIQAIL